MVEDSRGSIVHISGDSFKILKNGRNQTVFGNPNLPDWKDVGVTEDGDFILVDSADGFVFKFGKGAAGYNEIWQNSVQIIADERWVLEYWTGTEWKERGTPYKVEWERVDNGHVRVTRVYTDYAGTDFQLTYDIYGGFRTKLTVNGENIQADNYRLVWKASGINKGQLKENEDAHYVGVYNEGEGAVVFDYSDVYERFGDITTVDTSEWANGKKIDLAFTVGHVENTLWLDPNFGYEEIGGSNVAGDGKIRGSVFTITEDGAAESITVYLRAYSGSPYRCAIYRHDAPDGDPWPHDSSLMGVTEERTDFESGASKWYTFNFSDPKPELVADTAYVLVVWCSDYMNRVYYTTGDAQQGHFTSIDYDSFPDPISWSSHNNYKYSIYCSYTAAAAAGWKKLQYYTEPPTAGQWNKLKFASEPPVPGAWNRLLYAGE